MSPRARVVAIGFETDSQSRILLWDSESGLVLGQIPRPAQALAFSPDESVLAVGSTDGLVRLYNLPALEEQAVLPAPGRPLQVRCLAVEPNRVLRSNQRPGWVVAAGYEGGDIVIWDSQTRLPRAHCRGSAWLVSALAFHPGGTLLASAGRGEVVIWDAFGGQPLLRLHEGSTGTAGALAFSHDGSLLLCGSLPSPAPPATGIWPLNWTPRKMVLAGDGQRLIACGPRVVDKRLVFRSYDVVTGKENWRLDSERTLHNPVLEMDPKGTALLCSFDNSGEHRVVRASDFSEIARAPEGGCRIRFL